MASGGYQWERTICLDAGDPAAGQTMKYQITPAPSCHRAGLVQVQCEPAEHANPGPHLRANRPAPGTGTTSGTVLPVCR